MKTIMKYGVILGVVTTLYTILGIMLGWHRDPSMVNLFYVVILMHIVILVLALRQTAAEGRGYGGQVSAGLLISLIGGVIIILGSLLCTTVLFPSYFDDIASMQEQMLRDKGMSDAELEQAMDMVANFSNPFISAIVGFVGTMFTGLLASLVIAAFVRAKSGGARAPAPVA